ncbi:MAG: chitobiase/beta-hexosaminidase C-terminal domain-containing protein [Candidatus Moranbacteria bacterium]|nr:chitobiase/beta-hexosaminidase C-terminal domain-containing protein [Candidatus Moranbacteria bacterium]
MSVNNITYWRSEASYNGTVDVIYDGAGFLPHNNATNVKCYYCIAHHNYTTGIGDVSTGTNIFYNNISWANGYAVGDIFNGNTVTTPSTRGNIYMSGGKSAGSVTIKNTISGAGKPREITNAANSAYTVLDYNLYYPLDENKFYSTDEVNNISWLTYHSTNELHSKNANPFFTNSSANIFTLQNTSPAINAGTDVGLTSDYAGNPKSGANWDIGAYEFQDSTAPTTTANINTGTYNNTQNITLTCDDSTGVGCDKTYYTIDGSDPTTSSTQYSIPIEISTTTTLKFFSQDKNGNSETIKSKTYTIDTTPPTITGVTNNQTYYVTQNPTFSDGTATLNGNAYTSGSDIFAVGDYTLIATDAVGNSSIINFSISKTKTITNTNQIPADYSAGAISIIGTDPTQTTQATFNANYTINTQNVSVIIPQETQMTKTGGGNLDLTQIISAETTADNLTSMDSIKAIKFGIPNLNLTFSKPITIDINVGDSYKGQTLTVLYQKENETTWNQETSCTVTGGICSFQTTHATKFAATKDKAVVPVIAPTTAPTSTITTVSNDDNHKSHKNHKAKKKSNTLTKKFKSAQKWLKKTEQTFTRNLSLGSRGQDVGLLQTVLQKMGLMKIKDTTYGVYLSTTQNAVSRLQEFKHIFQTGVFGWMTRGLFR